MKIEREYVLKKCSKCKEKKRLVCFYKDKQKTDKFTSSCRVCIRKQSMLITEETRKKNKIRSDEYYLKYRAQITACNKKRYRETMQQFFKVLGESCARCGFTDKRALQIDHVHGGGSRERKEQGGTSTFYANMLKRVENGDFQILCANCNLITGIEKGYKKSIWI